MYVLHICDVSYTYTTESNVYYNVKKTVKI